MFILILDSVEDFHTVEERRLHRIFGGLQRIVSFHEAEGCELLEFHSQEMFLRCIDQYTAAQYRYQ